MMLLLEAVHHRMEIQFAHYIYFLKQEAPCDAFFSSAQSCDPFGYCDEVVYASRILAHWLLDMDLESDFLGRTSPLILTPFKPRC